MRNDFSTKRDANLFLDSTRIALFPTCIYVMVATTVHYLCFLLLLLTHLACIALIFRYPTTLACVQSTFLYMYVHIKIYIYVCVRMVLCPGVYFHIFSCPFIWLSIYQSAHLLARLAWRLPIACLKNGWSIGWLVIWICASFVAFKLI